MSASEFLLQCNDCHQQAKDDCETWWCRDCALTICKSCNLMHGHTEHRSAPWKEVDVMKTCVHALETRVEKRILRATDEEIEIVELLAQIQRLMLDNLHSRLESSNQVDNNRLEVLKNILGVQYSKKYHKSPNVNSNLGEDSIARLLEQTAICCAQKHTGAVSRLLPNDEEVNLAAKVRQGDNIPSSQLGRYVLNKRITPECVVAYLSDEISPRRLRTPSSDDSGAFSISREVSTSFNPPLAPVVTSTPIENDNDVISEKGDHKFTFPLEPHIKIDNGPFPPLKSALKHSKSQEFLRNHNENINQSPNLNTSRNSLPIPKSQPLTANTNIHDNSVFDTPDSGTNVLQNDSLSGRSSAQLMKMMPDQEAWNESRISNVTDCNRSEISTPSDFGRLGIVGFHFGSDFLTRPIDVCVLPGQKLAISDSCGGVYITNLSGDRLHKIIIDGMSASSLQYSPSKNHLFVSLLGSDARNVHIYEATDFRLIATLPCPTQPTIELSRTRWLAATSKGELFIVSGDNNKSALWKYDSLSEAWITICSNVRSRWQYLHVNEDRPQATSTVLLTCDGLTGSVLLLVVGRNNRLWAEYNLCQTYHLYDYIKSPASAVSDAQGNLLILDYQNGKLWLLADEKRDVRRLSPVAEIGSQGLGIAVNKGWVYVACLDKKRIQAVKYIQIAERHLSHGSMKRNSPGKKILRAKSRH